MRATLVSALLVMTPVAAPNIASGQSSDPCSVYPGLPCPAQEASVGPGVISFTQPTTLRYGTLRIADGTVLETNGHPLTINVEKDLIIAGGAAIRSFNPAAPLPPPPPKPAQARSGVSHDPGPNTEGGARSERGADGGPGEPGKTGPEGRDGADAGPIVINVAGTARGTLRVVNVGAPGGPGGAAGDGGDGGNGQQGGRATPQRVGGVVVGCARGPGWGGKGGDGGPGGQGGAGGEGGRGGVTIINVAQPGEDLIVEADIRGGLSGPYGPNGQPGRAGVGGYGGRGSEGCDGRETERRGDPGVVRPTPAFEMPPRRRNTPGQVTAQGAKLVELNE